jgi:hypothetical protein
MRTNEYAAGESGATANPTFNRDNYLQLLDELNGFEDDFDDVGEDFLTIRTRLTIPAIRPLFDRLQDFITGAVMLVWPLMWRGVISPTRAQARLDELARDCLPELTKDDSNRLIDCLLTAYLKCEKAHA